MTKLNLMLAGNSIFKILLVTFFCLIFFETPVFPQTRLKVKKIEFSGNTTFSTRHLKEMIKSRTGEAFNTQMMQLDRTLLTNYYQVNGFLDVYVSVRFEREIYDIFIFFEINEGPRYYLKEINFNGNIIIPDAELRRFFGIKDGAPFNRTAIDEGINKIEDFYFNNGKPYSILRDNREIVNDTLIILNIDITEGQTVYIADIEYSGLFRVRRYVVRRELMFEKEDIYSRKKIQESQRNIYNTGLFNFVNFNLVALDTAKTRVKLVVRLEEKKARWVGLRFGIAYDQELVYGGTFDFTVEGGHRNLFGTGRSVSVSAIPSIGYDFDDDRFINRKNQFNFTYVEPWIGYTRTPGILQFSYNKVNPTFARAYNFFNASFKVSHDFPAYWTGTARISFQRSKIFQEEMGDTLDLIYAFSTDATRDRRDNFLNPAQGYLVSIAQSIIYSTSEELSTGKTSINRFIKLVMQWNRYQPFMYNTKWTLATRIRGGAIFEMGELSAVPVLERFYLGGASSVRGYREQLLGPVNYSVPDRPRALGGKLMVLANAELRIPIIWLLIGEVFIDAGNVWGEIHDFKPASIKPSSGAGIALLTPLGPVRFDYGLKWFPEPRENRGEFHIGISFAF